jgi:protein tyrosine/serine phosphatase
LQKAASVKPRRKKIIKTAMALLCFFGLIAMALFWYFEEKGNFHSITPGEAYRSAQLDQDELVYYIRKFGIRSIINLRGKNEGEPWYEEETAACRKMDVRHYDLGLSAGRKPSSHEIEELIRLFRIAPRPAMIHCQSGADRSGLAAAFWKIIVDGAPKSVARKQLSLRYGHVPVGPTYALDAFLENWVIPTKARLDVEERNRELFKGIEYATD